VRCKTRAPLRHVLGEVMAARMDRRARVTIDIDPINML
jgi:primosomal protein N'